MTTKEAAATYLRQHLIGTRGRSVVVFNPHNKPEEELPYITAFSNGGSPGWKTCYAIADNGKVIGSHICSDEHYAPADLAVIEGYRTDRHKTYQEHYPDGYRMRFIFEKDVKSDKILAKALEENKKLKEKHDAGDKQENREMAKEGVDQSDAQGSPETTSKSTEDSNS